MPEAEAGPDHATQTYVGHRELLFSLVYNMLGSVADTEDVLQETWLSWAARCRDGATIEHPRAYLVRIAVNQALARQATLKRRRETYVGPWLPEPIVTAPDAAESTVAAESLSMALLVVLETLTPLERAVFVLNEVFGYPHPEIAEILGRTPAAVRQLAHRAREHVHARRPRYRADPRQQQEITERFVAALLGGDLTAFLQMLAPDVAFWSDGGGKARATPRPVHGRENVARVLAAISLRHPGQVSIRYRRVNGDLSLLLCAEESPFGVLVLGLSADGEQVDAVYTVTNPDKLSGVA